MVKGDGIKLFLGVAAQIRALGQVSALQTIGFFVEAPLPRAVRVVKEHLNFGGLGEGLGVHHLPAVVKCHRQAHGCLRTMPKRSAVCSSVALSS